MDRDGWGRRGTRSHRPILEPLDARNLLSGLGLATGVVGERLVRDVAYNRPGVTAERLDLYLPEGTPPAGGWPIILAFPGGGWRWASRQQYGHEVAALTRYGFAVAGVDVAYAGTAENGGHAWPANLQDAEDAVRWVVTHAGALHLDPGKVVAMGESAGANLALLLGTYPAASGALKAGVVAVVDFYGPSDMTALYRESRPDALPYIVTDLGGTPDQVPARYAAASPLSDVKGGDPPVLIVQGLLDHTVPASQSVALNEALAKAGVGHEIVTIPWAQHGFGINLVGADLTGTVVKFLDAALGLPAT